MDLFSVGKQKKNYILKNNKKMSYKIIEKNGVKHKVWSSVEEDFLNTVGGGVQDTATLFESAAAGVPTVLRLGILDAYTTTDEATRQRVLDFDHEKNSATFPEFTFLGDRLVLCFDLKKNIPFELHAKIAGLKKCIVTRESNFSFSGEHRNSYSNLTTSSVLNLQQDLQFLVQEDYNESIRLHDKLKTVGERNNYAITGESVLNINKEVPSYMIGNTYVENGNTMTGFLKGGTPISAEDKDAFFGLPNCILEAVYLWQGNLIFHLYRPSTIYANVSHTLSFQEKGKEYEFNVYLDINDLK